MPFFSSRLQNQRASRSRAIGVNKFRQIGATTAEMVIGFALITFLILGGVQSALVYSAKMHLNQATFEAVRKGAVNHGLKEPMQDALARNLIGLYGGGTNYRELAGSIARAEQDLATPAAAGGAGLKIEILNPTKEAFDDFSETRDDGTRAIPNDYLQYKSTDIGLTSKVNIQDANLLKIKVTYGYWLYIPFVNHTFAEMMQFLDPVHADYYTYSVDADDYKLPRIRLTASALMRMHTDPVENGNVDLAYFDKPAYGTLPETDPDADTLPEDSPATESTDVGSHGLQAYDEGEDETAAGANADTNESSEQSLIDKLAELKADCIRTSEEQEQHEERERWWDKAKAFFTDTVKQAVTAGFEFSEGFWDGLKSQGEEILDMITDPVKLLQDLKTLYEAFKEDPEATAQAIFEQVIQDSAQDMKNLVECGAYDRGYIVGKYINPVKLAQLISHLRKASPILSGLKKDDPVDLNGDGRIDTIDMGFPIVRDKDGDGQFSQQEFKDAGITDQDGNGLVDIKDMKIVCQLRFHSQFGQVIPIYASFPAGTPVATEHGEKPIEQIGLNDKVLALDPDTLELSYQPVTDLFQRRADTIWTITASGKFVEQIDATTEHPFYVQGKGWVMARDLNPGDLIITADNTAVVSRTIQSSHHDFVYNFTVANHNNYFVGKQQLWVHNVKAEKCGGGGGATQTDEGLFVNQVPDGLADELARAAEVGAKPIRFGDDTFDAAINQGTIKYVVTDAGEVLITPHTIDGVEISHAVLANGKPVKAAGQADISGSDGNYFGLDFTPHSGHFMNGATDLQNALNIEVTQKAFEKIGIIF